MYLTDFKPKMSTFTGTYLKGGIYWNKTRLLLGNLQFGLARNRGAQTTVLYLRWVDIHGYTIIVLLLGEGKYWDKCHIENANIQILIITENYKIKGNKIVPRNSVNKKRILKWLWQCPVLCYTWFVQAGPVNGHTW